MKVAVLKFDPRTTDSYYKTNKIVNIVFCAFGYFINNSNKSELFFTCNNFSQ